MLVLWTFYFVQAKSDVDVLTRETAGVELALAVVQGQADRRENVNLASALGLDAKLLSQPSGATSVEQQNQVLRDIHRISGLAQDSEVQSDTLGDIAFVALPALQLKLRDVLQKVSAVSSHAMPTPDKTHDIALAVGELKLLHSRIQDDLTSSQNKPTQFVLNSLKLLNDFEVAAEAASRAYFKSGNYSDFAIASQLVTSQFLAVNNGEITRIQTVLGHALLSRLKARTSLLWRNLMLLTFAGFICAAAGIGLVVVLLRATFTKLEGVEASQIEAQAARREAEQVALRFSTINSDISRLNQDLATRVKELKEAQDELLRKGRIEQLGQLTATIAHEIRNPLGAIRTSAFMLERRMTKAGIDTGEMIERIYNSVNRCDAIISQLHDFARVKEPNLSAVKLDDWLSKVVREEAKRLPNDVFIECALGLNDAQVTFDPVHMQRAVINLLNNSSEAFQFQDSQADSAGKQKTIWVSTTLDGAFAQLRVADNGPGIASEYLSKIREPLYTTKSFGSGLGIPVVEQIVEMQNGQLDIASELGAGTRVTIKLPLVQSTQRYVA